MMIGYNGFYGAAAAAAALDDWGLWLLLGAGPGRGAALLLVVQVCGSHLCPGLPDILKYCH